jgi:hypothetical protein
MESIELDLVPIQVAALEQGVSLTTLHKYVRMGRLARYRRGFDKLTYVDRNEIRRLSRPETLHTFTVEIPLAEGDPLFRRLLSNLRARYPIRMWEEAGWGHFVLVGGQRNHPYTVLKYRAPYMQLVVSELNTVLDHVDRDSTLDRHRIRISEHPWE